MRWGLVVGRILVSWNDPRENRGGEWGLTELLLLHEQGFLGRLRDDGGGEPEPLSVGLDLAADDDLVVVLLGVVEEGLGALVVGAVAEGREQDVVLRVLLGLLDEELHEAVVERLVDVDALRGDADLAAVEEAADGDARDDLGEVGVLADDGGVVARELEDHLLHRLGAVLQDALAHGQGAREADVVDALVQRHALAEVRAAAQRLEHARGEHGLGQLAELEDRVRREGGWLDYHAVACGQRRHYLYATQYHGEVPR